MESNLRRSRWRAAVFSSSRSFVYRVLYVIRDVAFAEMWSESRTLKISMKTCKIVPIVLGVLATSLVASEVYTVGMNTNPKVKSEGKEVIPWALFSKDSGKLSYELDGKADGEAFRALLELRRITPSKKLAVVSNGNLAKVSSDYFDEGEGLVVKVKVLSGKVNFDGFRAFSVAGPSKKDEGSKVNGKIYLKDRDGIKGTGCFALGGSLAATESKFKFEAPSKKQLRWIELQFSKGGSSRSVVVNEIASESRSDNQNALGALISIGDVTLIVE